MRGLNVEGRGKQRLENAPLIETKAVHDDEDRGLVALENRKQELADDINGKRRPVSFQIFQPLGVRALHVSRKLAVHVRIKSAQRFVETHLASGRKVDVPAHQLVEPIYPPAPVEIGVALELDCAEALDEAARDRLLPDARTIENPRHHAQHLAWIDRLDQVVPDVGADRFLERGIFLALGDHHHRQVRRKLANIAVHLEPALARHLLVEEENVERPASKQLDRVVGVRRPLYGIALGAQKDAVRLEELTFIVYPEYRFWGVQDRSGHESECSRGASPCLDSGRLPPEFELMKVQHLSHIGLAPNAVALSPAKPPDDDRRIRHNDEGGWRAVSAIPFESLRAAVSTEIGDAVLHAFEDAGRRIEQGRAFPIRTADVGARRELESHNPGSVQRFNSARDEAVVLPENRVCQRGKEQDRNAEKPAVGTHDDISGTVFFLPRSRAVAFPRSVDSDPG